MIKRLVKNTIFSDRPRQSIAAAALIISLAGIASRVLGLLRDRILAANFGAGDVLDAYYAAFRIPDLLYNLLILGALSAAFIPVFTSFITEEEKEKAWKLASGVLVLGLAVLGVLSLILALAAPLLVELITPGFSPEKTELTVTLTRIMFLSPLLLGVSGIFGGILVSFKHFVVYSLAPIFYNIGIILGVTVLVPMFGTSGLAWGVALGAFLHLAVQYPEVKRCGFRFFPIFKEAFVDESVRKVLRLMVPRMLGIAVGQVNLLVITIFASTLAAGSLAVFNFANNIQSAPLGLFGISFSIAVFPTLSALAARKAHEEFAQIVSRSVRQILFFVIPSSVLIFVLRAQIVRVVLGSGKFDWEDTILTFQVLGIMVLSLAAQSLVPLATRAFYAMQNTRTPFYIAITSELFNLASVFVLIRYLGVYGLAISFAIASVVNATMLFYFLKRQAGFSGWKETVDAAAKILAASFIAGACAQIAKMVVGTKGELDTFVEILIQFIIAGSVGVAAFSASCYYFKVQEFFSFTRAITRKVFRTKKQISEDTAGVSGM